MDARDALLKIINDEKTWTCYLRNCGDKDIRWLEYSTRAVVPHEDGMLYSNAPRYRIENFPARSHAAIETFNPMADGIAFYWMTEMEFTDGTRRTNEMMPGFKYFGRPYQPSREVSVTVELLDEGPPAGSIEDPDEDDQSKGEKS